MAWLSMLGKGVMSGAIVVAASEVAKKSTILGALIISIPTMSILSMLWLYNDTKDAEKIADYAEGILWLVIPSLLFFIILPYLLRRDWSFESAMGLGLLVTIVAYLVSLYLFGEFSESSS